MTVVVAKRSEAQVQKEIRALKEVTRIVSASSQTARRFLAKNGFITKANRLHRNYR